MGGGVGVEVVGVPAILSEAAGGGAEGGHVDKYACAVRARKALTLLDAVGPPRPGLGFRGGLETLTDGAVLLSAKPGNGPPWIGQVVDGRGT